VGLVGAVATTAVPAASGRGNGTLAAHAELKVTETYLYFVDQESPECGGAKRVVRTTARLAVPGKGNSI
jgi:hypothetical protein